MGRGGEDGGGRDGVGGRGGDEEALVLQQGREGMKVPLTPYTSQQITYVPAM